MIKGYVDLIQPLEVRGWTLDSDRPDVHLVVDVFCGDLHLGSTIADLYRVDLAGAGFGQGDHAFMFQCPVPLHEGELATVEVRVRTGPDPAAGEQLARWHANPKDKPARGVPGGASGSAFHDDTQFPVFVLGAPRSGTSAVAQALRSATCYQGHNEGHVLDLLNPLLRSLRRFYEIKSDEITVPERNTMIKKLPEEYFSDGISALFAQAVRGLFPDRHWIDKTPTADMIWAVPHLLRIWPNAKFIFLKRRALENLISRLRKFGSAYFESHCLGWTGCMEAWNAVRGDLSGRALEVDQHFLARSPQRVARAVGELLALAADDIERLGRVLAKSQPELTSVDVLAVCDAATMDWDAEKWAVFERVCGPTMASYGYSRDAHYYKAGCPDRSCHAL